MTTPLPRADFLELPVADVATARAFYGQVFGWGMTGFGLTYACTLTGDVDLGLQADPAERTQAPLIVVRVDDLDAASAAVEAAGGTITRPIFAFPGGQRFHFRDPDGNELAAHKPD
ncbi:VOC family protein [uncultured Sphingomonas sp.]|uniref:VOC family protein n=1 Tax=uncultured Sphingomonas sp. TaxID=158754 RepID=UPI0025F5C7A7|nr:VOC family protein [uncultured Sphingomonas sp.]